jgi:hypothetical protein
MRNNEKEWALDILNASKPEMCENLRAMSKGQWYATAPYKHESKM